MSVCNVKVKHIRPKYDNLREWMDDVDNVYIGRGGVVFIDGERFPKHDSPLANPFKINAHLSREKCISLYTEYFYEKLQDAEFKRYVMSLKGKNLACWCSQKNVTGMLSLNISILININ